MQDARQHASERLKTEIDQSLQNEDTARAIELLKEFVELNQENKEAQTLLVGLKMQTGQLDKNAGLKEIMDINASTSTKSSDQLQTLVILENESAEKAVEQLDKMISKYPDYYYNYYLKGEKLIELNRFNEAIKIFDQIIVMEPDFRYAYAKKALAQYMLGDKEGACNAWKTSQGGGSTYIEKYCK